MKPFLILFSLFHPSSGHFLLYASTKPSYVFFHCIVSPHLFIVCLTGFSGSSDSKESVFISGDLGLIPGLGRSPEEFHG